MAKTKRKARELSQAIASTGGGPSDGRTINDLDDKILDIVGTASVYGFGALEAVSYLHNKLFSHTKYINVVSVSFHIT